MSTPLGTLARETTAAGEWSVWSRGATDVRGPELAVDSADVRLRWNDVSTCVLTLPFTPQSWNAVARGTRVEVRRHRRTALNGPVIDRELVIGDDDPAGIVNVTVESDEGQLADRTCFPNPALPFLQQTNGDTYRQTAPAETVLRALVNLNAGAGALPARQVLGLTVDVDQGRGSTYPAVLRYDNLLTALQTIARDGGGLGFRVETTDTGRVFRVFEPEDLSASVRFSLALRNLAGMKYHEGAPTVTVAMSEGRTAEVPEESEEDPDTGVVTITQPYVPPTPLKYEQTTSDPASLEYGRRAEAWFDAGDSVQGIDDLHAPVADALGTGTAPVGLTLDPSPDYLYEADPATLLGAIVTVQVGPLGYTDTVEVLDVVREVKLLYDRENGTDDVIPTVGSNGATADVLNPYVGELDRRLSRLERR